MRLKRLHILLILLAMAIAAIPFRAKLRRPVVAAIKSDQPVVRSHDFSTSLSVYPGVTTIVGGGMPGREKGTLIYTFIKVDLVDPDGNVLRGREPDRWVE